MNGANETFLALPVWLWRVPKEGKKMGKKRSRLISPSSPFSQVYTIYKVIRTYIYTKYMYIATYMRLCACVCVSHECLCSFAYELYAFHMPVAQRRTVGPNTKAIRDKYS